MQGGATHCSECGGVRGPRPPGEATRAGRCPSCGAALDASALLDFTRRLARFGLGTAPKPLLGRPPELPNAK